tara:strand:+ start:302 stop:436 length:135 start_codon:yes stop_codon:yes gene_type:complete
MRLKKLLLVSLIISILSIGLGITAFAGVETEPWTEKPGIGIEIK